MSSLCPLQGLTQGTFFPQCLGLHGNGPSWAVMGEEMGWSGSTVYYSLVLERRSGEPLEVKWLVNFPFNKTARDFSTE